MDLTRVKNDGMGKVAQGHDGGVWRRRRRRSTAHRRAHGEEQAVAEWSELPWLAADRGGARLQPKAVIDLSPNRRVFESFTLMSWCFHCPCAVSYLKHVCLVVGGDEGIVDRDELHILALQDHSGDQTPDPSKSVNSGIDLLSSHGDLVSSEEQGRASVRDMRAVVCVGKEKEEKRENYEVD